MLIFLDNHSEIEWDLLYLGYSDIQATRAYRISEKTIDLVVACVSRSFWNSFYRQGRSRKRRARESMLFHSVSGIRSDNELLFEISIPSCLSD